MSDGEITEKKFKEWCKNKGYYSIKLKVSHLDAIAKTANPMPCDFIVLKKDKVYFIEVKEVLNNDRFPCVRFKQQAKLTFLKDYDCDVHDCFVLINFVKENKIVLINILDYNKIYYKIDTSYIDLEEFGKNIELFTWKSLEI